MLISNKKKAHLKGTIVCCTNCMIFWEIMQMIEGSGATKEDQHRACLRIEFRDIVIESKCHSKLG